MKRLRRNLDFLQLYRKGDKQFRKNLLKKATKEHINTVCECAHNTLCGNIPLSSAQKSKLAKHKALLRKLGNRRIALQKKRKLLVQKGGALLPLLIGPILSALLSTVASS